MSLTTLGAGGGGGRWFVGAAEAIDFANGWTLSGGTPTSLLTCTRASAAFAPNAAGVYSSFSSNVPRITDLGLLTELGRTNVVTYSRDLTNAAWVKSNVTAAKDQTGVDGVSNSASSIAATAGNGTVLLTTSIASSARFQTAFVKRLVGTGTIEMTMDNGSTWTAVTVTAAWSRVSIPSQTLADPVVGFRIGTSGDGIAVDFVQNENGTFVTSPIETSGSSVARAGDAVSLTTVPVSGATWTAMVDATALNVALTRQFLYQSGTFLALYGSSNTSASVFNGTNVLGASGGDWSVGARAASSADGTGRSVVMNGGTVATDAFTQNFVTTAFIGGGSHGSQPTVTRRLAIWSVRLTNAQLQAITA